MTSPSGRMTDDGVNRPRTATITALREHPRKPGRYEIELSPDAEQDQHPSSVIRPETHPSSVIRPSKLTVNVDLIADLKLKPGRQLTERELEQLEAGAQLLACYDKALATLGARARSTADLRRYLKTKDFTDEQITPAIEKLTTLGLLNDLDYARTFARSRSAPSRGLGPRRIAAELARKGVPRQLAEQALEELAQERQEKDTEAESRGEEVRSAVEEAAAKKLRTLQKEPPEVRKRRLYGYLARRGFSSSEILRAMKMTDDG